MTTFFDKHGWDVDIVVNGYVLEKNIICDNLVITKEENQSSLCKFDVLVSNPSEFIQGIDGQPIIINYYTGSSIHRLYTGWVDFPDIDLVRRRITVNCSNRRDDLISTKLIALAPTIGRYALEVQGSTKTINDEITYRMQTVPASLDFDSYNNYQLNSWYAKSSADFTLTDASIYFRAPQIQWQSRSIILNKVNLTLDYQYTRLYHYQRAFSWTAPYKDNICLFLQQSYSLLNINSVITAISKANWKTVGHITFTSPWAPGLYACGGAVSYVWESLFRTGTNFELFDEVGDVISDPDGNNIWNFRPFTTTTDLSKIFCLEAEWVGSYRFSQFVKEEFPITIKSTQSVTQFGTIDEDRSLSYNDQFDATEWEAYKVITPMPAHAVNQSGSYYFNEDSNVGLLNNIILTAIDKARVDILAKHRDTLITTQNPIMPTLELSHTMAISSRRLDCKGKVRKIVHTIDLKERANNVTETEISLFRSINTATTTPSALPPRPVDNVSITGQPVVLGNNFGVLPTDTMNGFIANKQIAPEIKSNYQEEFRVDTPPIPDSLRLLRTITANPATFEVFIPNDPLTMDFSS